MHLATLAAYDDGDGDGDDSGNLDNNDEDDKK
jgi:hypothetical protein